MHMGSTLKIVGSGIAGHIARGLGESRRVGELFPRKKRTIRSARNEAENGVYYDPPPANQNFRYDVNCGSIRIQQKKPARTKPRAVCQVDESICGRAADFQKRRVVQ